MKSNNNYPTNIETDWTMRVEANTQIFDKLINLLKRDDLTYNWDYVLNKVTDYNKKNLTPFHVRQMMEEYKSTGNDIDCTKVDQSMNYFDIFRGRRSSNIYSFRATTEITERFIFKLMEAFPTASFYLESYNAFIYTEFHGGEETKQEDFRYWKISN